MMQMRSKLTGFSGRNSVTGTRENSPENLEVRPCGMLVQKRLDDEHNTKQPPNIRVRVKYGSSHHEIHITSQATFGELKKKLSEPTGLHHEDQKLYYKDKERESKQFLDIVGVKDKSKLVLMEDPISQEKRYLQMRKTAVMEKAAKSISHISLQVDKLAAQVATLDSVISKGGRVAEKEIISLIELLMNELVKLDSIIAEGDVKSMKKMQVRRVQKYVETLDMLKGKNTMPSGNVIHKQTNGGSNGHIDSPERASNHVGKPPRPPRGPLSRRTVGNSPLKPRVQEDQQTSSHQYSSTAGTVVTTQWETFDSTPLVSLSDHHTSSASPGSNNQVSPKFPWDVFA